MSDATILSREHKEHRDASEIREWTRGEYSICNDRGRLDLCVVHAFLTQSYWAKGRSLERVAQTIEYSLPFGLYLGKAQIGFARVVTDYVVVAFLADVFVLEDTASSALVSRRLESSWRRSIATATGLQGRVAV